MYKVAIVGKPNVGKSTLFNRLSRKKISVVDSIRGVTRDRIYNNISWLGHNFTIIDTGGIVEDEDLQFIDLIKQQTLIAIKEADIILFLVNITENISYDDQYISNLLKKVKEKVILVPNFYDNIKFKNNVYDFYCLGFPEIVPISSIHGNGIGDLLDKIVSRFKNKQDFTNEERLNINIIGKPNVGKSTLVNAILNEPRTIVSEISGTTRDLINVPFRWNKKDYTIVDTAGIKRRTHQSIDKYSNIRSINSTYDANINILVLDISKDIEEHDKRISSFALDSKKGLIIVANKWDLVKKNNKTYAEYEQKIRMHFKYMKYVKIIFISALNKIGINNLLCAIKEVNDNQNRRIKTRELNELIQEAFFLFSPPVRNKKKLKVYYVTQSNIQPPTFIFFVNDSKLIHFSYKRYLENKIRENYNFEGTPINLIFRSKGE